jgi:hypothetical protein
VPWPRRRGREPHLGIDNRRAMPIDHQSFDCCARLQHDRAGIGTRPRRRDLELGPLGGDVSGTAGDEPDLARVQVEQLEDPCGIRAGPHPAVAKIPAQQLLRRQVRRFSRRYRQDLDLGHGLAGAIHDLSHDAVPRGEDDAQLGGRWPARCALPRPRAEGRGQNRRLGVAGGEDVQPVTQAGGKRAQAETAGWVGGDGSHRFASAERLGRHARSGHAPPGRIHDRPGQVQRTGEPDAPGSAGARSRRPLRHIARSRGRQAGALARRQAQLKAAVDPRPRRRGHARDTKVRVRPLGPDQPAGDGLAAGRVGQLAIHDAPARQRDTQPAASRRRGRDLGCHLSARILEGQGPHREPPPLARERNLEAAIAARDPDRLATVEPQQGSRHRLVAGAAGFQDQRRFAGQAQGRQGGTRAARSCRPGQRQHLAEEARVDGGDGDGLAGGPEERQLPVSACPADALGRLPDRLRHAGQSHLVAPQRQQHARQRLALLADRPHRRRDCRGQLRGRQLPIFDQPRQQVVDRQGSGSADCDPIASGSRRFESEGAVAIRPRRGERRGRALAGQQPPCRLVVQLGRQQLDPRAGNAAGATRRPVISTAAPAAGRGPPSATASASVDATWKASVAATRERTRRGCI